MKAFCWVGCAHLILNKITRLFDFELNDYTLLCPAKGCTKESSDVQKVAQCVTIGSVVWNALLFTEIVVMVTLCKWSFLIVERWSCGCRCRTLTWLWRCPVRHACWWGPLVTVRSQLGDTLHAKLTKLRSSSTSMESYQSLTSSVHRSRDCAVTLREQWWLKLNTVDLYLELGTLLSGFVAGPTRGPPAAWAAQLRMVLPT
jgi:hypothetical protein